MSDDAYRRYVHINLPHARTIVSRIGRTLEALGVFGESGNGGAFHLLAAYDALESAVRDFDEDPPFEDALRSADDVAVLGRALVEAILGTPCRGDRLGQSVRNLFECLGLPEEGARWATACGERPDSPLR
ncbi:MAG: hypothetical protein ACHQNV_07520 [Vicinamibacteria bacterium]